MSQQLSLLTWNVMGHSPMRVLFDRVVPELKRYNADIMCLQEGPDTKHEYEELLRLRKDTVLSSAKLFSPEGGWHRNYITTTLPVESSDDLHLSLPSDCGADPRESNGYAMWADVLVGDVLVRVYNCHLRIRGVGITERLYAIAQVFEHAKVFSGPVVICGDMNTTLAQSPISRMVISKFHDLPPYADHIAGEKYKQDERHVFHKAATEAGYRAVFDITKNTWAIPPTPIELFRLKLDWVLIKDMSIIASKAGGYITDHRALYAELAVDI